MTRFTEDRLAAADRLLSEQFEDDAERYCARRDFMKGVLKPSLGDLTPEYIVQLLTDRLDVDDDFWDTFNGIFQRRVHQLDLDEAEQEAILQFVYDWLEAKETM